MQCLWCGKETKNPKFCSRSCSASYNNHHNPKRIKKPYIRIYPPRKKKPFENTLDQYGVYYLPCDNPSSKPIRSYLISKHGNKCMICSQSGDDWHNKPLTLIVDHINGHANDWRPDNIRLVCPNCDSQLPTFKGRNKGNSKRTYTITQKI